MTYRFRAVLPSWDGTKIHSVHPRPCSRAIARIGEAKDREPS